MKLNIQVMNGRPYVSTVPENSNNPGINLNVTTDSIKKVADTILSYTYDSHGAFVGGFSLVRKGGLYGYVNLELKESISPKYPVAYDVCEGYARVLKDGKYRFIQMEGCAYPHKVQDENSAFDDADDVKNGMARVKVNGKIGFFSTERQKVIIPCEYEAAEEFSAYRAYTSVKKDGKWGLVGKNGTIILEPVFDSIFLYSDSFHAYIGETEYQGNLDGTYREI